MKLRTGNRRLLFITLIAIVVVLAYLTPIIELAIMSPAEAKLGVGCLPSSTAEMQSIIDKMKAEGSTMLRVSFSPQWNGGSFSSTMIQYYLDHAPPSWIIIVDRNHLFPNTEAQSSLFRNNIGTARSNILGVCNLWPNNQRVYVELANEYVSADFKTIFQGLINDVRNAGYSNPIVINKMAQSWSVLKLNDPKGKLWVGMHFYFNTWSPESAKTQMNYAITAGLRVINTEIGADMMEYNQFSSSEVAEVNTFLTWCKSKGISNCVWTNHNLDNFPKYDELKLIQLTSATTVIIPTTSYSLGVQANIPVKFTVNGGTYTTPKYLTLSSGSYTVVMPSSVVYNGQTMYFRHWGDGSTNPTRTISLTASIYPYATYS